MASVHKYKALDTRDITAYPSMFACH